MEKIVERITQVITPLKITGKDLGNILGLKKSPLTDWKNGKSKPTLEQIIAICEYFAVSVEWIITGKDAGNLTPEEQLLVDAYRAADQRGKRRLENAAREELREQTSSASQIGSRTGTEGDKAWEE